MKQALRAPSFPSKDATEFLPLHQTHDIKDITPRAREHCVNVLLGNTFHLQMIALCFLFTIYRASQIQLEVKVVALLQ